jgi:hypothetical protein
MEPTQKFIVTIGEIGIGIETETSDLHAALQSKYVGFVKKIVDPQLSIRINLAPAKQDTGSSHPGIVIALDQIVFNTPGLHGRVDFFTGSGDLQVFSSKPEITVDYALRNMIAILAVRNGGLMFHGAGIIHSGAGCLFFGPSGSGKTTVAAHLLAQDTLLNDDLVLVMKVKDRWQIFGTPFTHPEQQEPTSGSGPLCGMFRLVQDQDVFLEEITRGQALAELVGSLPVLAAIPAMTPLLLARVDELIDSIPVQRLHFLPDFSFWEVVHQFLFA